MSPQGHAVFVLVDIIGLDACVQTQEMELYRALNTSKLDQCLFKIRTTRLDLSCVGIARICVLLEQVDPRVSLLNKSECSLQKLPWLRFHVGNWITKSLA